MLFNSFPFLFAFLPIVMVGFHLLGRYGRRPVIAWLGLASLVFYAAWKGPVWVVFLLASIGVNYLCARAIAVSAEDSDRRKRLLFLGVTLNLLALFYFKYLMKVVFFLVTHHVVDWHPRAILLPLGISFFTFTQISYLVDLAQGQAERQDFLSYLLFVTFFPHLIAGPILHHKEMMPQFGRIRPEDAASNLDQALTPVPPSRRFALKAPDVSLGLTWFVMGLAKKVLIADSLSQTADRAFQHAGSLTSLSALTGLVVYSMQLYFDFSGYSDMALGLARIFSIRFPLNFDSPYKAISVTEYWQRWHMTLTRYITLYLYNPILLAVQRHRVAHGRKISRKTLATPAGFTTMVAYPTIATMLLTGLWHGAGLQFLVFGLIHGVYLTANQAWRHFRQRTHNGPAPPPPVGWLRVAMMLGVYIQVTFALIFFRSNSMHSAIALLHDIAGAHGIGSADALLDGILAFALFPVVWFMPNTQQILGQERVVEVPIPGPAAPTAIAHQQAPALFHQLRWSPSLGWGLFMGTLFLAILTQLDPTAQFLYFQF